MDKVELSGSASLTSVLIAREGQTLRASDGQSQTILSSILALDQTVSINAAGDVVFKALVEEGSGRHSALFRYSTFPTTP
jgi:hypothetical protein